MTTTTELKPGFDWLLVRADTMASGLWDTNSRPISVEDTPLSAELLKRLDSWTAWYDRECELHVEVELRKKPGFDSVAFAAEGRAIAQAIKEALPSCTVMYEDYHLWVTQIGKTVRTPDTFEISL